MTVHEKLNSRFDSQSPSNSAINHNVPSRNLLLPNNDQSSSSDPATIDSSHPDRVVFRGGSQNNSEEPTNSTNINDNDPSIQEGDEPVTQPIAPIPIHSKTKNWYSNLCNRWASLFGAVVKIIIMMLVNWYYALSCICVVFLVWFYVGTLNPAVKPGVAAEFRLFVWLKSVAFRCFG